MHPVSLIANALNEPIESETQSGICCVTGLESETLPRKSLFGKSFTDGEILKAPDSDRVSVEAYIALKYKWERMSSWVCDGSNFVRIDRIGVRNAVFGQNPTSAWSGYATTSYKKHGSLRAVVNSGDKNIWLFETRLVDCSDIAKRDETWNELNKALQMGIGRSILETLDCPVFVIRKIGLSKWMQFEEWAKPLYKSALYAFMCYLLPSQEELRKEKKHEGQTAQNKQ